MGFRTNDEAMVKSKGGGKFRARKRQPLRTAPTKIAAPPCRHAKIGRNAISNPRDGYAGSKPPSMTETPPQNPPTLQSSGRRHRHGATRRHPRAQYSTPPRIMCAGLTCIRAIAAAARTAGPRRRPPGTIPSPARPRSPAGARNAGTEVEGSDDSRRGARHRPAWVRCGLFWSEPRGRTYMTPGPRADAEHRAATSSRRRHLTRRKRTAEDRVFFLAGFT